MFSRLLKATAILTVASLALPAATPQVEVGGLGAVDPFGVGFLEEGERAMPTDMWKASRTEDLLPLMRKVRTRNLTPAERSLLRRVALSPAARPNGEDASEVLAERARILYELGEAEAAADLMARLDENARGIDGDAVSVDLQLALGSERSACARVPSEPGEGAFWARLRAVCAVLNNDQPAAELAVEFAQSAGVNDDWFYKAVLSPALPEGADRPPAKFDTGLNLALSTKLGLEPPDNAITPTRPDLATAMATRQSLPVSVRVLAAGVAAEAGLMDARTHRRLYSELLKGEGFKPARPIEVAVLAFDEAGTDDGERARKLAMALRSSSANPARFAAASRLFANDLARLPRNRDTVRHALTFAQAELATGNLQRAEAWSRAVRIKDAPPINDFAHAMIDGLILLSKGRADRAALNEVAGRVVEHAKGAQRKAQAARLFALWTALEMPPPAPARALMAAQPPNPEAGGSDWRMLAIGAAAEADAAGEAVLSILSLTRGDPSRLPEADMIAIIDALAAIGADDVSRDLALEAAGYWKSIR